MSAPTFVPDHVAVAVPDFDAADARWRDELGGRWASWHSNAGVFRVRQLRYRGGAKLELLQPHERDPSPDNFVRRYLARFGAGVHHVTVKVADLDAAIDHLHRHGLQTVDRNDDDPVWKEAFVRPSLVGGLIVQVAESHESDAAWAARKGITPESPPADGARLLGPVVEHPDLDRAAATWQVLGAHVGGDGDGLVVTWDADPLQVHLRPGAVARAVGLRFADAPTLPASPVFGAAVLA